jgi:arylsulfatase A-like enzyme
MLDALEGDDLFLYLHLMEVHAPYGPAEPADPEHWNRISGEPVSRDSAFDRPWALTPTAAQRRALYEHDVRVLDRELGRFLDRLLERFERDGDVPVTIAVMSDHGEFLGEYGQWGHAFFTLYPEVVHVPLILRAPGRIPPGTLWRAPVENRQIGPTLLELAGVPAAGLFPAPSLLQSIGERAAGSQPPFALASGGRREDAETLSLFGERFSYLGFSSDDRRIVSTFADTRALERIPPAWPFNALEEAVQGVWQSYLESQEKVRARGWADVDERTRIIDPRERSMLRALGYVDE